VQKAEELGVDIEAMTNRAGAAVQAAVKPKVRLKLSRLQQRKRR
jgi:hypothetical protein